MIRVTAFAPAHITGLFFIHDTAEEPLLRGSLGAGFSIDHGARTTVSFADAEAPRDPGVRYSLNGTPYREEDLPVSASVYRLFSETHAPLSEKRLRVDHRIDPPQSSGFGTSGAGALSMAMALNAALDYPFSHEEAAGIAHTAEVENKTGLGTVIGEYYGGFEIRTEAGAPGFGKIEPIASPPGLTVVCAVFGPYSTRVALSDYDIRNRINTLGRKYHAELLASPTVESFLSYAHGFSRETGLLTETCSKAMELMEKGGYTGGMLMFGEAVFTLLPREEAESMEGTLKSRFPEAEVFSSRINSSGGKIL